MRVECHDIWRAVVFAVLLILPVSMMSGVVKAAPSRVLIAEQSPERELEQVGVRIEGNKLELTVNSNFLSSDQPKLGKFRRTLSAADLREVEQLIAALEPTPAGETVASGHGLKYRLGEQEIYPSTKNFQLLEAWFRAQLTHPKLQLDDGVELKREGKRFRVIKSTRKGLRVGLLTERSCPREESKPCQVPGLGRLRR